MYIATLLLGHYIEIKRHNLDVITQMRLCQETYSDKGENACINVVKQQAIPNEFYKAEGSGFE